MSAESVKSSECVPTVCCCFRHWQGGETRLLNRVRVGRKPVLGGNRIDAIDDRVHGVPVRACKSTYTRTRAHTHEKLSEKVSRSTQPPKSYSEQRSGLSSREPNRTLEYAMQAPSCTGQQRRTRGCLGREREQKSDGRRTLANTPGCAPPPDAEMRRHWGEAQLDPSTRQLHPPSTTSASICLRRPTYWAMSENICIYAIGTKEDRQQRTCVCKTATIIDLSSLMSIPARCMLLIYPFSSQPPFRMRHTFDL